MKGGVVIHGNYPQDRILVVDKYPEKDTNNVVSKFVERPGGIANIQRGFDLVGSMYGPNIPVTANASPEKSKATIIIDKATGTRTSLVDWNRRPNDWFGMWALNIANIGQRAAWNHFAYTDVLGHVGNAVEELREKRSTVSADLAGVGISNTNLKLFDYVFVSARDRSKYNLDGVKTIVHSPECITLEWLNQAHYNGLNPQIVNTLGAGDILAAVFIHHMLTKESDTIYLALVQSRTEKLLLEEQWLT
jgi:sugar/nucleoside kinase (ribokinase family)